MKEARSGVVLDNVQELLDASGDTKAEQYLTPEWLVDECRKAFAAPETVIDPQCAEGALLKVGSWANKYGFDIDSRLHLGASNLIVGNCVKVAEAMDELYPKLHWEMANANPPFGRKWKRADGTTVDSTEWTWEFVRRRGNYGFFIANKSTIEALKIDEHPWVFDYDTRPANEIWKGVRPTLEIGIVWWRNPSPKRKSSEMELDNAFTQLRRVVDQEKVSRPDFNIYLDKATGELKTYLSVRSEVKLKLDREKIMRLHQVNGCHPLTLTTDKETRDLMRELIGCGLYRIQPEAQAAIDKALKEVATVACPIMPITDFESVAYADEEDALECVVGSSGGPWLTAGRRYSIRTGTYRFTENFKRTKVHYSEKTMTTYTKEHECTLSGQDRYIEITDDRRQLFSFRARPTSPQHLDESKLWHYFKRPDVPTLGEVAKDRIEQNLAVLRSCEMLAGFDYYPGQLDYLARVAAKDSGLVAAATGCHAKGTQILMSNGDLRSVEDIRVGDSIMGWDGMPSMIRALAHGTGKMYRIKPFKGEAFVVNEDHILTLVRTNKGPKSRDTRQNGRVIDVSVKEWLAWPKSRRHMFKLFRRPVDWYSKPLPVDPYLMGLILGDGSLRSGYKYHGLAITTGDAEIESYVRSQAERNGWKIRTSNGRGCKDLHLSGCDSLRHALYALGLHGVKCEERFIPDVFRVNNQHNQLQLLAGLLDSDGHLTCGGFDFISKSKRLAEGVAFLCRSVGLAAFIKATIKSCQNGCSNEYHRVSISGDCAIIPCRVKRKKAPVRKQKKSVLRTGFAAEFVGIGDYYGFNIGGDGRFLMGDFTVTHNTGKTLMAISLLAMKTPARALIIAPQGTMRSSEEESDPGEESEEYNASQWVTEINRFAPYVQIWEIFSYEDYERICSMNGGTLPPGVYVSYYEAMFTNKARENAPDSWDDTKLNKHLASQFNLPPLPPHVPEEGRKVNKRFWCDTIGIERNGIRSIISPCLATQIGSLFDMVILDEAHKCTNLNANITQMLVRLQPKYRWALTATPIPNIVSNLFSLMGWIAVPGWYRGGMRNAAWPYARDEIARFNNTFLSQERDLTQEEDNRASDPMWRGICIKASPVISSPARLLKLLKPSMAYISKEACNPSYIPPRIVDVRVPMGKEQSALYAYYLERGRIPGAHALIRARKQTAWLRNICADPAGFRHGDAATPKVTSNMNPKVVSMLELTRDILSEGKQVVIINSRVGLTNTLQHKLAEAGVPIARIDSTINPEQHAAQANLFKKGKARVMLMGIRCAAAYSFDLCKYLIVGSLEYSPGPFNQAIGRIDRVTNAEEKTIYVILHKDSIEEIQFDVVATKDDAATICLKGKRIPRNFKPVDGSEILASAIEHFDVSGATPESECETKWPVLRDGIRAALRACHP